MGCLKTASNFQVEVVISARHTCHVSCFPEGSRFSRNSFLLNICVIGRQGLVQQSYLLFLGSLEQILVLLHSCQLGYNLVRITLVHKKPLSLSAEGHLLSILGYEGVEESVEFIHNSAFLSS